MRNWQARLVTVEKSAANGLSLEFPTLAEDRGGLDRLIRVMLDQQQDGKPESNTS